MMPIENMYLELNEAEADILLAAMTLLHANVKEEHIRHTLEDISSEVYQHFYKSATMQ